MSSWALGTAWALSVLSLFLALPVASIGDSLSRTMLCGLFWIALAGLPRSHLKSVALGANADRSNWIFYAGLLPVLAVGAGLDRAAGHEALAILRVAAVSLVVTGVLALAAVRCRRSWLYALVWTVLVPVPVACLALPDVGSLESGGVLTAAPLGWALRELVSSSSASFGAWPFERDLGLLLSSAVLLAFALRPRRAGAAT